MSDNTPYEDGDGTEVARLARELHPDMAAAVTRLVRDHDAEIDRLRARAAMLEAILTNRNAKL